MQPNRSKVALQQINSTDRVRKHRDKLKESGYKRKIFIVSDCTEYKLREYAKRRKKPYTHILDDLMRNVF